MCPYSIDPLVGVHSRLMVALGLVNPSTGTLNGHLLGQLQCFLGILEKFGKLSFSLQGESIELVDMSDMLSLSLPT